MKEFEVLDINAKDLIRGFSRLDKVRAHARVANTRNIDFLLFDDDIRVLWSRNGQEKTKLPSILIGADSTFAKVLPKMLALPGALAPITSFVKVWSVNDVKDIDIFSDEPLNELGSRGFIGLVVGELIATVGPDVDFSLMGLDGVRRTLSFVCAQAVTKGWKNKPLTTLVERWVEASALTSNDVKIEIRGLTADLCEFLRSLLLVTDSSYISARLLAINIDSWTQQQGDFLRVPLSDTVDLLLNAKSREARFDIVMEALTSSMPPLAHGFLISLIEPSSMEFLELAKRADRQGTVAIAYCLCIAILGEDLILREFNGFGLAVLQQGLKPEFDTPVDISIAELKILYDSRRSEPIRFRTRSPSLIDVELAPMVSGSFGNGARRRASTSSSDLDAQITARIDHARLGLMTAMRAIEKAYDLIDGPPPGYGDNGNNKKGFRR